MRIIQLFLIICCVWQTGFGQNTSIPVIFHVFYSTNDASANEDRIFAEEVLAQHNNFFVENHDPKKTQLERRLIFGQDATPERVEEVVDEILRDYADATVFWHVYEHGQNSGTEVPSVLTFTGSNQLGTLDVSTAILERLKDKVQFLVLLVDACNEVKPMSGPVRVSRANNFNMKAALHQAGRQDLYQAASSSKKGLNPFLDQKGYVVVSTAQLDQKANIQPLEGGYGSTVFYQMLNEGTYAKNWLLFLDAYKSRVEQVVKDQEDLYWQTPFWFCKFDDEETTDETLFYPVGDTLTTREYLNILDGDTEGVLTEIRAFIDYYNQTGDQDWDRKKRSQATRQFKSLAKKNSIVYVAEKRLGHGSNNRALNDRKPEYMSLGDFEKNRFYSASRRQSRFFVPDSLQFVRAYQSRKVASSSTIAIYRVPKIVASPYGINMELRDTFNQLIAVSIAKGVVKRIDRILNIPKALNPPTDLCAGFKVDEIAIGQLDCKVASGASAEFQIIGGVSPFQVTTDGQGRGSNNPHVALSGLRQGSHRLVVRDERGCSETSTFFIKCLPNKSVWEQAHDFYNDVDSRYDLLAGDNGFFTLLSAVAENYKDEGKEAEFTEVLDLIFENPDSIGFAISSLRGKGRLKTYTAREVIGNLFRYFGDNYNEVAFNFCQTQNDTTTYDGPDGTRLDVEELEKDRLYRGFILFKQAFTSSNQRGVSLYQDNTQKRIEVIITNGAPHGEPPVFSMKIRNVEVLETVKELDCLPQETSNND